MSELSRFNFRVSQLVKGSLVKLLNIMDNEK